MAGPAGPAGPAGASARLQRFQSILFDFDRSEIRSSETGKIDAIVEWARANPGFEFVLNGSADERGSTGYNKKLSERRVQRVRGAMQKAGIETGRIGTFALGEEAPLCDARTEACWQENRRVDVFTRPRG